MKDHFLQLSTTIAFPKWAGFLGMVAILFLAGCSHHNRSTPAVEYKSQHNSGSASAVTNVLLEFYRGPLNHLSAVRRGVCPMYPSCSQYAREAVATHGFVQGWIMAHDRLMRCGRDETTQVPRIRIAGTWKYYDPVENNVRLHQKQPVLKEGKWLPKKPLRSKS